MSLSIDITKIVSEVWGGSYVGRAFPSVANANGPDGTETINDGLIHKGTNGSYYMTPTALNDYQLPNEPLIAISGGKKIVKTSLAGNSRSGTVKEIINTDDYEINIRGVIINENSLDYPFSEVEDLKDLYELNESLSITNAITKMMGIENVVITKLDLPEMVGRPNMQAYQINCVSDEDFVLIQD